MHVGYAGERKPVVGRKDGSGPETAGSGTETEARRAFGELLRFHFKRGTRPDGSEDLLGKEWSAVKFAEKVGLTDRAVRDWLNGSTLPGSLGAIEKALFGDADYTAFRNELRVSYQAAKSGPLAPPPSQEWTLRVTSLSPKQIPVRWVHATTEDEEFAGRAGELERLDRLVRETGNEGDTRTGVIGVHAMGGGGKTALIAHWLKQRPGLTSNAGGLACRPFEAAFSWSFGEDRDQVAALSALARFLAGVFGETPPEEKQTQIWLRRVCDDHDVCIFFDGLEVIQERTGAARPGEFLEGPIGDFIWSRCGAPKSVVLLTSRFRFGDLEEREGRGYRDFPLNRLEQEGGVALLLRCGVRSDAEELARYVEVLEGHALGLRVLALALSARGRKRQDSVHPVQEVASAARLGEAGSLEARLGQLFTSYEEQIDAEDAEILALVALFPVAVGSDTIARLMRPPQEAHFVQHRLRQFAHDGVVHKVPHNSLYSVHPLIRDHFGPKRRDRGADAAAELFDKPATFKPRNLEEARLIVSKIELLTSVGDFAAAYTLFSQSLGFGELLKRYDANIEALNCALAFVSTAVDDQGHGGSNDNPFYRVNRLSCCRKALAAGDVHALIAMVHRDAARLGLWNLAIRYVEIARLLDGEGQSTSIAWTEFDIERDVGDILKAEAKALEIAEQQFAKHQPPNALLSAAKVRNNHGFRRIAFDYFCRWASTPPTGNSLEAWLSGWFEICKAVPIMLARTNQGAARRYALAYQELAAERFPGVSLWSTLAEANLAIVDRRWEDVVRLCRTMELATEGRGEKHFASQWMLVAAEGLTNLGFPEEAIALIRRGVRMVHPGSWTRLWAEAELLRANLKIGMQDSTRLNGAFDDGFALIAKARERDLFSVVLSASQLMVDSAKLHNEPTVLRRAERNLAEAVQVRDLEDGWEPDLGPLPGEEGWDERVVARAIASENVHPFTGQDLRCSDAMCAHDAYWTATMDDMPRVAERILKIYPDARDWKPLKAEDNAE